MCGRYGYTLDKNKIEKRIGGYYDGELTRLSVNVAPQTYNPIAAGVPTAIKPAKWGLIPSWSKDGKMTYPTFNARSEELHEKATYRSLIYKKHCLVPFNFFYEWRTEGKVKIPFRIELADDILVAAGLWEVWRDPTKPEGENLLRSYTMLTTAATESMQGIHDRMPLLLPRDWEKVWIDPTTPKSVLEEIRFSRPNPTLVITEADPQLNKVGYQPEV